MAVSFLHCCALFYIALKVWMRVSMCRFTFRLLIEWLTKSFIRSLIQLFILYRFELLVICSDQISLFFLRAQPKISADKEWKKRTDEATEGFIKEKLWTIELHFSITLISNWFHSISIQMEKRKYVNWNSSFTFILMVCTYFECSCSFTHACEIFMLFFWSISN